MEGDDPRLVKDVRSKMKTFDTEYDFMSDKLG